MEFLAASMLPPSLTMNTPARAFTSWSCVESSPHIAETARAASARPKLQRQQEDIALEMIKHLEGVVSVWPASQAPFRYQHQEAQ